MAKIQLKKADKADKPKKRKTEKGQKDENIFWNLGGEFIVLLDDINDEFAEIGEAGKKAIFNVGAGVVSGFDKAADLVTWFLGKTIITLARQAHELRIGMQKHRKAIVKHATVIVIAGVAVIAIFSSVTDYEYLFSMNLQTKLKERIQGGIFVKVDRGDNLIVEITRRDRNNFEMSFTDFSNRMLNGFSTDYAAYEVVKKYQKFVMKQFFK